MNNNPEETTTSPEDDQRVDADLDNNGEVSVRERFSFVKRMWRTAPRSLRRSIVGVVGVTLLVLGALLVVLPGPFTLPLVIAGLAVLASEFSWAEQLLIKGRARASRLAGAARRFSRR